MLLLPCIINIYKLILKKYNLIFQIYILCGKEFNRGGSLFHGREFTCKIDPNQAGHSIVGRDMHPILKGK